MKNLPLAFTCSDNFFSVAETLECGQVFRYKKLTENRYAVYSADKYAEAEQSNGKVSVFTEQGDYFWNYFDLDSSYEQKALKISAVSPIMQAAASAGKGIRILRQDPTETLFSFIISANNNIKRIQSIVEKICAALGQKTDFGYAFPTVSAMAAASPSLYRSLGAGYRDQYLSDTANALVGKDFSALNSLSTVELKKQLLGFQGVGPKVADCVLLFGFGRGEAFPVDTWLKKAYHRYFEAGHKDADIAAYFCELFGKNAGLAQQYLFFYERNLK